jgi:hypothetical protein
LLRTRRTPAEAQVYAGTGGGAVVDVVLMPKDLAGFGVRVAAAITGKIDK